MISIRESHHLRFNGWTVSWTFNLFADVFAGTKIVSNKLSNFFSCPRQKCLDLIIRLEHVSHYIVSIVLKSSLFDLYLDPNVFREKRKRPGWVITAARFKISVVDGSPINPGRCPCSNPRLMSVLIYKRKGNIFLPLTCFHT